MTEDRKSLSKDEARKITEAKMQEFLNWAKSKLRPPSKKLSKERNKENGKFSTR